MGGPVIRHTLDDLASRFGLERQGDGSVAIEGVGTLAGAGPAQVGFLANPSYRKQLAATRAGAVILCTTPADAGRAAAPRRRPPRTDGA